MDQPLSSHHLEDFSVQRGVRNSSLRKHCAENLSSTQDDKLVVEEPDASLDDASLLRFADVRKRVGMGRTAVYALIKAGEFPRPVKVGAASAWIDTEITRWIRQLAARRVGSR